MTSFNRGAQTGQIRTAVMPHRRSDVVLYPVNLPIAHFGAHQPDNQDDLLITEDAERPLNRHLGFSGRHHLPGRSPNRTAVMPHQPSNVVLYPDLPINLSTQHFGGQPDNFAPHPSLDPPVIRFPSEILPVRTAVMPHHPSAVVLHPLHFPTSSFDRKPKDVDVVLRPDDQVNQQIPCFTANLEPPSNPQLHSPVTHLPPEILSGIFELCLAREDEWTPFHPQGPLYLAQICTFWRSIVESDPQLWTYIDFNFPEGYRSHTQDVPRVKRVFDLHLNRARSLPMSLTFIDDRIHDEDMKDIIVLLFDHLRAHAPRWKRISLRLSMARRYITPLSRFTPRDLFSLEHLHIIGGGEIHFPFNNTPLLNLECVKNLKSFKYCGPGYSFGSVISLHWEQLAEVSFDFEPCFGTMSMSPQQLTYLSRCQNITVCSLGINQPFRTDLNQTITLPRLQTFRVRRLHLESNACSLINPLILPQLQTLEIDSCDSVGWGAWDSPWHYHNFSNLLARSGRTLLRLSIQDVDFPNDELLRCLTHSPLLESFRFVPWPRSQDIMGVIRMLDVSRGNTGTDKMVPKLREITLGSSAEAYLDSMMAMFWSRGGARARATGVSPLRHVEVVYFDMPYLSGGACHLAEQLPWRVVSLQRELARWVSENMEDGMEHEFQQKLEASVVVDSPYLVEYIDLRRDSV